MQENKYLIHIKRYFLKFLFSFVLCAIWANATLAGPRFNTTAKQAILVDALTGKVLFEKSANELMIPSSMTKIMTAYVVFGLLKQGRFKLEDTLPVSKNAWRKGGSRMFVKVNSDVSIEDLLRGVIIQSGNDASIVLAEGLFGTEEAFAAEMTRMAHELGAHNTTFLNATGWPDPQHLTTAADLALLADRLIKDFPDFYKRYFAETAFTYNKIRQLNRNSLLYRNIGADGLKTGYTDSGGHGLVASAEQKGQRFVLVMNGFKSKSERAKQSEAMMLWGFRNFITPKVFVKGEEITKAHVWLGEASDVSLIAAEDIIVTIPRDQAKHLKVEVHYTEPIAAPLQEGQVVGRVVVTTPEGEVREVPVITAHAVNKAGFFNRISAALYYLFWGHNQKTTA